MSRPPDFLYDLLPKVYQERDAAKGYPLQAFLRLVTEQLDVVEDDVERLYENWFIETCEDWVVPYLGDLVGYTAVNDVEAPCPTEGRARGKFLVPRRDVALTVGHRRRKGAARLLGRLAADVAGWAAHAVEYHRLIVQTVDVRVTEDRAAVHRAAPLATYDVRNHAALRLIGTAFEVLARVLDVRSITSTRTRGRFHFANVGLHVWRLRTHLLEDVSGACLDESENCFTFSLLRNDAPLFRMDAPEARLPWGRGEADLPVPICRETMAAAPSSYYGPKESIHVEALGDGWGHVPVKHIHVADLSRWEGEPRHRHVLLDPELGRLKFSADNPPDAVRVRYVQGSAVHLGGGPYDRVLEPNPPWRHEVHKRSPAGPHHPHGPLEAALHRWRTEKPKDAVIEIQDSEEYTAPSKIELHYGQSLRIQAASGARPLIHLTDSRRGEADAWEIAGPVLNKATGPARAPCRFTLDGIVVDGNAVHIHGDVTHAELRHCTLVPGWDAGREHHGPHHANRPSLELRGTEAHVRIRKCVLGAVRVVGDRVGLDPAILDVCDSIIDAGDHDRSAIWSPATDPEHTAHLQLTLARVTVRGAVRVHAIDLAEDSIFDGKVQVHRRQEGCIRYCWIRESKACDLPKCFHCEPATSSAHFRFDSRRFGAPDYMRLALDSDGGVREGAQDGGEMGAHHDEYFPQRIRALRARIAEYSPADMDCGVIFED